MTLPTVPVTCVANDQGGNPVAGAQFTFELVRKGVNNRVSRITELYNGLVAPEVMEAIAGPDGTVVINLFPNALGVKGSQYRVTAINPDDGEMFLSGLATIPNAPTALHLVMELEPLPPLNDVQVAQAAALASANTANNHRLEAQTSAEAAADSASDADASAQASAGSAAAAEQDRQTVQGITAQFGTVQQAIDGAQTARTGAEAAETHAVKILTHYGPTPPENPELRQEWVNSNNGRRYTYINDGDTSLWVESGGVAYIDDPVSVAAAVTAKNSAEAARDLTLGYRDTSEANKNTAVTKAGEAAGSAVSANTAKVAAEAARDAVNTTGKVFTTTAAGIAGTVNGQSFAVLDASLKFWNIYLNNAGVAALQTASYTKAWLDAAIDPDYGARTGTNTTRFSVADPDGFEIFRVGAGGSLETEGLSIVNADKIGVSTGIALLDADGFYAELLTNKGAIAAAVSTAVAGTARVNPLADLRVALTNELRDVNALLIGDSITWGMTVTGGGVQDPRTHQLTDPRNNLTSPSWANLLHQYLGGRRSTGVLTNPTPGVALYTSTHKVDAVRDPKISVIEFLSGGAAAKIESAQNAGAFFGTCLDVANGNAMVFDITGDNFTVMHTVLQADVTAGFEVFVDNVSQGFVSTYDPVAQFGKTATYAVPWGPHTIKLKCTGLVRFEGVQFIRKIRVKNNGLIGTNTTEWVPSAGMLANAVASTDEFVFVQLGTNDRALTTVNNNPEVTKRNLSLIGDYLATTLGKKVILMAANFANNDTPSDLSFKFSQADVARMTSQLAAERGWSFVDNYQATLKLKLANKAFLADGLHPNDAGHLEMFLNIALQIENAT